MHGYTRAAGPRGASADARPPKRRWRSWGSWSLRRDRCLPLLEAIEALRPPDASTTDGRPRSTTTIPTDRKDNKAMRPDKGKDTFARKVFRSSRLADFATEAELIKQTGQPVERLTRSSGFITSLAIVSSTSWRPKSY